MTAEGDLTSDPILRAMAAEEREVPWWVQVPSGRVNVRFIRDVSREYKQRGGDPAADEESLAWALIQILREDPFWLTGPIPEGQGGPG